MKLSRRELLKTLAGTGAAIFASPGALLPTAVGQAQAAEPAVEEWKKSPCRFCGVGCGVLVGLRKGKVVAVKGDAEVPVNRGLLCIKGYSLPKILYGPDRYKVPLLRQGNKFVQISWSQALDIMASKFKEAIQKHGPESVAMYFSGQTTIFEGYAVNKLMKAGIGSNNIESNARLCMASAVTGFYSTFGMDEPMGCYDDIELTDTFLSGAPTSLRCIRFFTRGWLSGNTRIPTSRSSACKPFLVAAPMNPQMSWLFSSLTLTSPSRMPWRTLS